MNPEYCPHCGAEVPPKAKACPECGSCEETGWSGRAQEQNLGLPDDEFNYDEFVQKEFGEPRQPRRPRLVWVIAAVLLLLALLGLLR